LKVRDLKHRASDSTTAKTLRGPQPELVRDYDLLLDDQVVVTVTGNYLRKRVHRLATSVTASRLRLAIRATNGAQTARVFALTAY
jgi:hypothetical protein